MNPYLEQPDVWHDFHSRFVCRLGDTIARLVRPKYVTKVDENVYIHEVPADERWLLGRPDVSVVAGDERAAGSAVTIASSSIEARAIGKLLPSSDRVAEPFIEIRDAVDRELVTVVELLSPTNKRAGADREQYLAKRRLLLSGNVHLVEIDLLRGDARMPVENLADCGYCVLVSRSYQRPQVELWPIELREPLPVIPIPLQRGDLDATVDLQALLHDQYDAAGYADYIYQGNPRPPLSPSDKKWAAEYLVSEH
jgi:hypothetical protein